MAFQCLKHFNYNWAKSRGNFGVCNFKSIKNKIIPSLILEKQGFITEYIEESIKPDNNRKIILWKWHIMPHCHWYAHKLQLSKY